MKNSNLTINSKNPPLSVLIITYNEEHNISKLLQTINFADEILVVDSYSTDNTIKIAASFPKVRVIQHPFENYAAQRNFAIGQAKNNWILFLDADERLLSPLKKEILHTIQNPQAKDAYYCYRSFMFKNQRLYFSGWQTDKATRLFKKEKALYSLEKTVHEKLIINGTTGKLKNKLIHYTYIDYSSYKSKMIHYGKLKAVEELKKGTKPHFFHFYIRPVYQFLNQYLLRLGFLDGKNGLTICYLNALSVAVRFQELKKLKAD
ncbi:MULTISPECIES: glycosyltransferase family 2 protein [unclassified Flavobacterium]|uniref:glycosyltransferase family 2 protein n=1 Tax=unclassified Flavobacterium TaxID=196869 RepID=UPI003F8FE0B3